MSLGNGKVIDSSYVESNLMKKLNQDATIKARNSISKKYQDPADLDDLSIHISQLKKDLSLAESQLNVALQGKLDALKRAADIIDESSEKLTIFSSNLHKIDERIELTNTVISNYPYLCRVHNARENILKVKSQVEFFARVPEKVKELQYLLDSDPSQLREVYLESIKLDSLRRGLLDILERGYSDKKYDSIRTSINRHLIVVPELMKQIEDQLLTNILRFYDLGLQSPADLVMTFEILAMNKEYTQRRTKQLINRIEQKSNGSSIDTSKYKFNVGISFDAKNEIRLRLSEMIEKLFESAKFTPEYEKEPVKAILSAATVVISKMIEFYNEIVICIPPEYEAMNMFVNAFESRLLPELHGLLDKQNGYSMLEVQNLLEVIDWIEYYIAQMEAYEYRDTNGVKELRLLSEELLNEYLYRIKSQIVGWFENIKKLPLEIIQTDDGTLTTSRPEDMFQVGKSICHLAYYVRYYSDYVVHVQIIVATEKLPGEHLKDAVYACLQVVREVQRASYDDLASNWKSYDVEMLCAFVNDYYRLQENCDGKHMIVYYSTEICEDTKPYLRLLHYFIRSLEFGRKVVSSIVQPDHREVLKSMLDEAAKEYVVLANTTVSFLAKNILEELNEAVFYRLFTAEWEAGEPIVATLIATLDDYFKDISKWLPKYFYSKFVHEVFITTIGSYLMSLRRLANGAFYFMNEVVTAARIRRDEELLREFFEKHDSLCMKHHESKDNHDSTIENDVTSPVSRELIGFKCMAVCIGAPHVSGAEKEIKLLYSKYQGDGLKLVQAIILSSPSLTKSEKQTIIEKITKIFNDGVSKGLYTNTFSENFKSFDVRDSVAVKSTTKQTKARFWNRKN